MSSGPTSGGSMLQRPGHMPPGMRGSMPNTPGKRPQERGGPMNSSQMKRYVLLSVHFSINFLYDIHCLF